MKKLKKFLSLKKTTTKKVKFLKQHNEQKLKIITILHKNTQKMEIKKYPKNNKK